MPTYVFQVRFPPRKHGVRGNECQKRSVVSVWYAQNSLPFCTEACYTTLTGCEDPTKMLIRVCILLQMQPAPLTGTATLLVCWLFGCSRCSPHPSRGQQLYEGEIHRVFLRKMQPVPLTGTATLWHRVLAFKSCRDAARTPHGDSNPSVVLPHAYALLMQPAPLTGTTTSSLRSHAGNVVPMQPAPLTGTATAGQGEPRSMHLRCSLHPSWGQQQRLQRPWPPGSGDAARTPHGDSNQIPAYPTQSNIVMQPAPLTGTTTCGVRRLVDAADGCSPHPSRGQQHYQVAHLFQDAPMQPAPLTGTATTDQRLSAWRPSDAARTPHGDSNFSMTCPHLYVRIRCSPCPSRGQQPSMVFIIG